MEAIISAIFESARVIAEVSVKKVKRMKSDSSGVNLMIVGLEMVNRTFRKRLFWRRAGTASDKRIFRKSRKN